MELESLLSAIAAPDELAPRQVLAEGLAELGDGRGELIHLALALEDPTLGEVARRACAERVGELAMRVGASWAAELRLPPGVASFHRGMIEEIASRGRRSGRATRGSSGRPRCAR